MRFWVVLLHLILGVSVVGAEPPADPLKSVQWPAMYAAYFAGEPVSFDSRVKVMAPAAAEDSLQVPIMVDARQLGHVQEILVFADLNSIPTILRYFPRDAQPVIGFRFKVQQRTPVRGAARTADGVWHVGGVWLEATGGGCTTPSMGSGDADWATRLGEVSGGLWERPGDERRLKFRVIHPMDTGLAAGIPAFYVETTEIRGAQGHEIARVQTFEPVSENPVFSLDINGQGPVEVSGRDNNGRRFKAEIEG